MESKLRTSLSDKEYPFKVRGYYPSDDSVLKVCGFGELKGKQGDEFQLSQETEIDWETFSRGLKGTSQDVLDTMRIV